MSSSTIVIPAFPTNWVVLPQINGFYDFDVNTFRSLSYRKISQSLVQVYGVVKTSQSLSGFAKITQLPLDCSPNDILTFFNRKSPNLETDRFDIHPNGTIYYIAGDSTYSFVIQCIFCIK